MGGKTQAITMFLSDLFCVYIKDAKWLNGMQSVNKKVLKTLKPICRYAMLHLTRKDCCDRGFRLLELPRSSLNQISLLEKLTSKPFQTQSCSLGCSFKQASKVAPTYVTLYGYRIKIISHQEYCLWSNQNLKISLSPCAFFILIACEGCYLYYLQEDSAYVSKH